MAIDKCYKSALLITPEWESRETTFMLGHREKAGPYLCLWYLIQTQWIAVLRNLISEVRIRDVNVCSVVF
jgi:hypothetical protein